MPSLLKALRHRLARLLRRALRRPPAAAPLDYRHGRIPAETTVPDEAVDTTGVDVIVPVYGAAEEFAACLDSLLEHTDLRRHRLVVVLDGSRDALTLELLELAAADPAVALTVLENPQRLGFVGSVNRGMAGSRRDVVLLNSDTIVARGWLESLCAAAASAPEVATVTPFSNHATICSLPRPLIANPLPPGHDVDSFAALVASCAERTYPRLPTGVGVCLYVKRRVLDQLGPFDAQRFGLGYGEESEFSMRALKAGYVHVLDDAGFVFHHGHRSFGRSHRRRVRAAHPALAARHPEYLPTVARFLAEDPLEPARARVRAALAALAAQQAQQAQPAGSAVSLALQVLRAEGAGSFLARLGERWHEARRHRAAPLAAAPAAARRTALLHLLTLPPQQRLGGVQMQLAARARVAAADRPFALLYPQGSQLHLEVTLGRERWAASFGPLRPASAPRLRAVTFERAVLAAAAELGARQLHVESSAELPLASLLQLCHRGLELLLAVHDFGLFCPRPHLFAPLEGRFCGACQELPRCQRCLAASWDLDPDFQPRRRRLAAQLLAAARAVVFPSELLRRSYHQLFPSLPAERTCVIPPALDLPHLPARPIQPPRELHHVAFAGAVQTFKGAGVFEQVVQRLSATGGGPRRWSVYGGGDPQLLARLRRLPGLRVHGHYRTGTLPQRLHRDRVDLVLLLSTVPETYSLTLDECRHAGVPVLTFDHGAPAERLRAQGGGVLVPPEAGAEGVVAALARLRAAPRELAELAATPCELPAPAGAEAAYRRLYQQLGW